MHLIEIWKGGSDGPEDAVLYDDEARKHMNIVLKQVTFTYTKIEGSDKKTEKKDVKSSPVDVCSEDQFKTEYEKKFYYLNKEKFLLCAKDENVYIQGTRDSRVAQEDHSFLIYEFTRC